MCVCCRYPHLFGSDDRMHACMAELGIPLTKEPGFHQVRYLPFHFPPFCNVEFTALRNWKFWMKLFLGSHSVLQPEF
jgi:hypothetical protein